MHGGAFQFCSHLAKYSLILLKCKLLCNLVDWNRIVLSAMKLHAWICRSSKKLQAVIHGVLHTFLNYVTYMIGDVFMLQNLEETQKMIDAAKEKYKLQKNELTAKCEAITQIMQELKVALYAKFGNNINLESEEWNSYLSLPF